MYDELVRFVWLRVGDEVGHQEGPDIHFTRGVCSKTLQTLRGQTFTEHRRS